MKSIKTLLSIILVATSSMLFAQDSNALDSTNQVEMADESAMDNSEGAAEELADLAISEEPSFTEKLQRFFIDGGIGFMVVVLLCLVLGVSIAIERIIYLSLSTINHKQFLTDIESALQTGGVEKAKQLCTETRGPIASIFHDGLKSANEGPEAVERVIVAGGSVQMGLLEKGISWISLFIALAPMLGFLGTVLGMIESFNAIEDAGGIKPTVVAGGIKTALITTVAGLVVAIILQVFYNFIVSKIDALVNSMEDASNDFVQIVKAQIK